jgi:hypothetical protein
MVGKDHQEEQEHEAPVDRQVLRVREVPEGGEVHGVSVEYQVLLVQPLHLVPVLLGSPFRW